MAKHRRLMVEICHREPCAHPGPRRLSTLSIYAATVSALGAISSQGLLPQVPLQSRRTLLSRGVCSGSHYPPLPNNLSLSNLVAGPGKSQVSWEGCGTSMCPQEHPSSRSCGEMSGALPTHHD